AGDAGGDRGVGRHLDQLRLEAFLSEVALLLGDEKLDRGDAAAGITDRDFGELLRAGRCCEQDRKQNCSNVAHRHCLRFRTRSSKKFDHFLLTFSFSSGLAPETSGNWSRHSYGRVASISARELKPFSSRGIAGSSGPLQQRSMISIERDGSLRVLIAQMTSSDFVMSTSSSTTTT